jgi:putative SOS response-associated peptidase YedK
MCGRYTLTYAGLDEVVAALGAILDPAAAALHRPRYNIAPATTCVIAREGGAAAPVLVPARWGLHAGERLLVNVRAETAGKRLARRRCVIPADGFYEWTGERSARRPLWFHRPGGGVLLMAGVYDEVPGAEPAFAVLTTASRPPVAAIHERMPLLFLPEAARRWLERPPGGALHPDDVALLATEVSPRVNSAAHDDPACLEPPPPPKGQLGLF